MLENHSSVVVGQVWVDLTVRILECRADAWVAGASKAVGACRDMSCLCGMEYQRTLVRFSEVQRGFSERCHSGCRLPWASKLPQKLSSRLPEPQVEGFEGGWAKGRYWRHFVTSCGIYSHFFLEEGWSSAGIACHSCTLDLCFQLQPLNFGGSRVRQQVCPLTCRCLPCVH